LPKLKKVFSSLSLSLSLSLISVFLLSFSPPLFAEETITITTYYPSPYGVYREMRAKRIAIGDTYFDGAEVPWEEINGDGGLIDYLADLVVEGNVGIGTTNPNANAILDISSTTKAIMLPRMTTVQKSAISPPAAGMVVYDTTEAALYAHNGSAWVKQGGGSTCVVTYNSAVGSCSCPSGWTLKLALGSWGCCYYDGNNFFRPPGGGCPSGWGSDNLGEGCLCCQ
jgi:hypothetical protein